MRVLVTGGAGYIGSHAARALKAAGYEVIIYDNLSTGFLCNTKGFEFINADIATLCELLPELERVDAVMHFAANAYVGESVQQPRKYFKNNVASALTLLNAAVDCRLKKFVFSSSCAVYGNPPYSAVGLPITEDTPRAPINPYGASKLFFENALEAYSRAYGLNSVSLRYFNAAGSDGVSGEMHTPETHLIPLAIAAARKGPRLKVYGTDYPTPDGTCIRDYVHVCDIADAHVRALQYLDNGGNTTALNIGSGRGTSVFEVMREVSENTYRTVGSLLCERREGDPPRLIASYAKARSVIGWTPKKNLSDIVRSAL